MKVLDTRSTGGGGDGSAPVATPAPVAASGPATPFDPSYGMNPNGSGGYDYNGTSQLPTTATNYFATLQQAEAAWFAANPAYASFAGSPTSAGIPNDTAGGTIASGTSQDGLLAPTTPTSSSPTTPTATDPFSQLTSLLGNLASAGPGTSLPPSTDTGASAVPTQNGPSLVLPILLIALAGGIAFWWYKSHHGHHAEA